MLKLHVLISVINIIG